MSGKRFLSVTLLTCCLQCFLQECGLTAEMIHLQNSGVLGWCPQGILIRWKMQKVRGPSDRLQRKHAKTKRQQFIHSMNYQPRRAWTACVCADRDGTRWINNPYYNLHYQSGLSVRWFLTPFSAKIFMYNHWETEVFIVKLCSCVNEQRIWYKMPALK